MIKVLFPTMSSLNSSNLENLSFDELFVFSVSDFILGDKDSPNSPNAGLDQVISFFIECYYFILRESECCYNHLKNKNIRLLKFKSKIVSSEIIKNNLLNYMNVNCFFPLSYSAHILIKITDCNKNIIVFRLNCKTI